MNYNKKMSNISKQEIISNLKDKISQFKSNFSKNKESRKEVSDLNFEINRDALKLFYKNKQEGGEDGANQEQQPKKHAKIEDIYDIKKILNENKPKSKSSSNNNLIKIEKEEKKINNVEPENKNYNIGAKIKTNFAFGGKEVNNEEINKSERNIKISNNQQNEEKEKENKDIFIPKDNNENMNINPNVNVNNFEKKSNFNFEYENYSKCKQNNNNNNVKDNNNLGHITLNNSNYNDFSIDDLIKNRKMEKEKRDKSAPKINFNQKLNNNFYMEKPLTDKHNQNDSNNLKNINYTTNYTTKNDFNPRKSNKTEELYQKLLVNFNINTKPNKKNTSFYNFNIRTNNNNNIINNYNYNTKENNPNKSYGQINIKDINLLYEINGNTNNYNQKKNYFRNELNLDHLKDLYNKKTEDNHRPTTGGLKSKMDLFYQELNEYKNSNYNKKQTFKNYFNNDKFLSNNKYINNNSQYNNYIKNTNNKNLNLQNLNLNEQININKNNGNSLSYNEIHAFKQYLKNLSKEEINNLPYNIKSELKDIFNILYLKFNE